MKLKKSLLTICILLIVLNSTGVLYKEEKFKEKKFGDTFNLRQGYRLYLDSVDWSNQTIILQLIKANGEIVDSQILTKGSNFNFYDHNVPYNLIINATFQSLFIGRDLYAIRIVDLVQYNKNTGKAMLTVDNIVLFKHR